MNNELTKKILELKKERNAVILAHNYQTGDVQDIADHVGDSLDLSIAASKTQAEVIVFCGVHFMAETAAILCPDKIVVMPDVRAGCPMADMITGPQLRAMKRQYPKAAAVCYINTSAEVKAESDIVCTSGNAVKVCQSLAEKEIIFVPDQYLGNWVSQQVKDKKFILWNGYCHIHTRILPEVIVEIKKLHPGAEVMVHPECTPAVIALADKVLGTGGMVKYAKESKAKEFIIGTESGLIHRLQKENPDKKFYPAADNVICPNMKLITLEKVLWSLQDLETKITVEREISVRAKKAIARMLENV